MRRQRQHAAELLLQGEASIELSAHLRATPWPAALGVVVELASLNVDEHSAYRLHLADSLIVDTDAHTTWTSDTRLTVERPTITQPATDAVERAPAMSAIDLARLRALAAAAVADPASLERPAADVGRAPQRAGKQVVLARHPEAPSATDLEVVPTTLPDSALVALGLCVGLAWDDRDHHPYPGHTFTIDDVTAAARAMRINVAASRHIIGAVRHILAQARLVEIGENDVVRLGPASPVGPTRISKRFGATSTYSPKRSRRWHDRYSRHPLPRGTAMRS